MSFLNKILNRLSWREECDVYEVICQSILKQKITAKEFNSINVPTFNECPYERKSNTLFILGSGPSINLLGDKEFSQIEKSDSVGLNYWVVHDFVPDFYFAQFPPRAPKMATELLEIFLKKKEYYRGTNFLIRGLLSDGLLFSLSQKMIKEIDANFRFPIVVPIPPTSKINAVNEIDLFSMLGFLTFGHVSHCLVQWRSTIGLIATFAIQMGYKNVVFLGADMRDNTHFWDYSDQLKEIYGECLPPPNTSNILKMTSSASVNTVPDYLSALSEKFLKSSNVRFFVGPGNSVLNAHFPKWKF